MPRRSDAKARFAAELEAMMRDKPLCQVRVRDLCERLGVQRCTFYYHFRDKYDLVAWMLEQDVLRASEEAGAHTQELFVEGLRIIWERRDFYRAAFEDDSQNSVYYYHLEYCYEVNEALLKRYLGVAELSREASFEVRFFSLGNAGSVAAWLKGDMKATPVQLAASLFECMPPLLRAAYASQSAR